MSGINEATERLKNMGEDTDALSSAINSILSDPNMMSMVASLANTLKNGAQSSSPPEQGGQDSETTEPEETIETSASMSELPSSAAINALSPLLKGLSGGNGPDDRRTCLLKALKPYLSKSRCEAIDHIITFSRLSGMFKSI